MRFRDNGQTGMFGMVTAPSQTPRPASLAIPARDIWPPQYRQAPVAASDPGGYRREVGTSRAPDADAVPR